MKKVIKAQLILPIGCLDILFKNQEELKKYFYNYACEDYEVYSGEIDNKEYCFIDLAIINKTIKECNINYKLLKQYLYVRTSCKPKQRLKIVCDLI